MARRSLLLTDAPPRARSGNNTRRAVNRGRLLRMLESERIATRVVIDAQARLLIESQDWGEYWSPVAQIGQADKVLDSLGSIWSAYIQGSFPRELQRDYCYHYFRLLDRILEWRLAEPESELAAAVLRRVLGFECFSISNAGDCSVLAAATSALRNPAYLLTKLRTPDMLDSGEHLPLISTVGAAPGRLFYHYRQHRLSRDSSSAILSYLDVDHGNRSQSFRAVALLEEAMAGGTDPFAAERAARMARAGILDYVRAWVAARSNRNVVSVELVDLGAGSGLVAAKLCSEIAKCLAHLGYAPRFRIWFVDISMSHPARFFASEGVAKYVDSIQMVATDYHEWLGQGRVLPECDGVRLVLISRFFNNLSSFAIRSVEQGSASDLVGSSMMHSTSEYQPTNCLAPDGPGPERLVVSNARVWLETGRTFKQASLSPYFLGLRLTTAPGSEGLCRHVSPQRIYIPVRTFRAECLLTRRGDSILGTLARQANLIVVQDADMRAGDLRAHCSSTHWGDIAVFDATRHAGLRGHFSYLVAQRADPLVESLPGERIW
jgi:hypothetical protein